MTKTISLSDEAYEMLAAAKRPGESFSDTTRRLARLASQENLFRPSAADPVWSDEEAEELKRRTYRARDESMDPRYEP